MHFPLRRKGGIILLLNSITIIPVLFSAVRRLRPTLVLGIIALKYHAIVFRSDKIFYAVLVLSPENKSFTQKMHGNKKSPEIVI